ncbi:hypothetical protein [Yoonia vestfoldensis]|uniref:Flagellar biosynthesis protein, FliO n=1 Tax=Yoonia vestfoldensis TaxID=245188 RepID=A0A1Y0EGG7_9RHOB|nr:hypothetical protein [Yoonia vestfoldensis]ARU02723.1 hypothetical protein LOKVESSMR4R_03451 [Yoonia vestfoldensis]
MQNPIFDTSSIVIVVVFLAVLLIARQIIVSKAGVLRQRILPAESSIKLCETQRIDRTTQVSLFELDGQSVAIVHGPGKAATMLLLPPRKPANE